MCKAHLAALTWLLYAQLSYSKSHFADGTPGCKVPGNVVYVLRLSGIGSAGLLKFVSQVYLPLQQLYWQGNKSYPRTIAVRPQNCSGYVMICCQCADAPANLKLSATVAAGLVNRHVQAPAVFNILLPTDEAWLLSAQTEECTLQNCTWAEITVPELWQLAYSSGILLVTPWRCCLPGGVVYHGGPDTFTDTSRMNHSQHKPNTVCKRYD